MVLLVIMYTIPINLVVDMVGILVLQMEVMVVPQKICMGLVQIPPLLPSLEDVYMTYILNNMTN